MDILCVWYLSNLTNYNDAITQLYWGSFVVIVVFNIVVVVVVIVNVVVVALLVVTDHI